MKIKPWAACLSITLFFVYEFIQCTMLDSLTPLLMKSMHIDAAQVAYISAAYFYTNILFLIPAGIILDKYSLKQIAPMAISISLIGTFIFSQSHTLAFAIIARLISGIGGAFAFNSCAKAAIHHFSPERFPFVIGIITSLAFLGGVLSHAPLLYLATQEGWDQAILKLGEIGIAILLVNFFAHRDEEFKNSKIIFSLNDFFAILKNKFTWIGGIYTSLINLPVILLSSMWSTLYLTQANHLSSLTASFCSSATFIGLIIGSPFVGLLASSAKNTKRLMQLSAASLAMISLVFIFPLSLSVKLFWIIFFLLGIVSSAQTIGYSIVIQNNSFNHSSLVVSIASIIVLTLGTLLKVLFGKILDFGWKGTVDHGLMVYPAQDFAHAMIILPISFLMAFLIAHGYVSNKGTAHQS